LTSENIINFTIRGDYVISARYKKEQGRVCHAVSLYLGKKNIPLTDLIIENEIIKSDDERVLTDIENIITHMDKNNMFSRYIGRFEEYISYINRGIENKEGRENMFKN